MRFSREKEREAKRMSKGNPQLTSVPESPILATARATRDREAKPVSEDVICEEHNRRYNSLPTGSQPLMYDQIVEKSQGALVGTREVSNTLMQNLAYDPYLLDDLDSTAEVGEVCV
jgi:hypothetical protein